MNHAFVFRTALVSFSFATALGCSAAPPASSDVAGSATGSGGGAVGGGAGSAGHGSVSGAGSVATGGSATSFLNGGAAGAVAGSSNAGGAGGATSVTMPEPTVCAPSWAPSSGCGAGATPPGAAPDFGPRVLIFDPGMSKDAVQSQLDQANQQMANDQFDDNGYAYLFKPGQYGSAGQNLDVRVGFYTQLVGLGKSPDDVVITGAVRSKAYLPNGNATCNFWRGAENFAVVPGQGIDGGTNIWAVSQGTALRRAHVKGSINLSDNGWSSGGFIADTKIDNTINSGTQQQFLTRNDGLNHWQGHNWNMVFVGDAQAPQASWPNPPMTVVDQTPKVREKPFLYLDADGHYLVMVPKLKTNSNGYSWGDGAPPGSPVSIDDFYIAKPGQDTASTINAALAMGKHLLLTPGDYKLDSPIEVDKPNTIVLGLGFPVLTPTKGNRLVSIADVDGVSIAGILIEAAPQSSPTLLQAGATGSSADHAKNPSVLFDVHCRVGGNISGTASVCFTINSSDVIIDNTWLWRADHGNGAGWNSNKSESGIVVNGKNVTVYGLFSEHFQKFQTLWNGEGGQVFFYQSELPYDPPNQGSWQQAGNKNGYPSYKVADGVTTHQAQGIGIYSFFNNNVHAANAIETPIGNGIVMHHMMTYGSGTGGIDNIINDQGGSAMAYSSY